MPHCQVGRSKAAQSCWTDGCRCSARNAPPYLHEPAITVSLRARQVSRGEVDKLLDRVDINNDGHVEFGELASALVDWRQVRQGSTGQGCVAHAIHRRRGVYSLVICVCADGLIASRQL